MANEADRLSAPRLQLNLPLLLLLFVSFRLALLMAYPPALTVEGESGIGVGGDRLSHYRLSALAGDDLLPFRDWWSEFPPLWHSLTTGLYLLLGDGVSYASWSLMLGALLLSSELGNLLLLRAIASHVYDAATGMKLAWIYGLMAAPAIFMWWNFDSLMTLFFLLGIHFLLKRRDLPSAIAIGVGILLKFLPALLIVPVLRARDRVAAVRYAAIMLALVALVYLPLLALNADFALVSIRAQFEKNSHQTIWALIDGNVATGNFAGGESRFAPDGYQLSDNARDAVVPAWLRLGLGLAILLMALLRMRRHDKRGLLSLTGFAVLIAYLAAQGWSPQWVCLIIPLTLLILPNSRGVLFALALTLLALAEYPLLWSRTGDLRPAGQMGGALLLPWAALILLRTGLLIGLALTFHGILREPVRDPA